MTVGFNYFTAQDAVFIEKVLTARAWPPHTGLSFLSFSPSWYPCKTKDLFVTGNYFGDI